MRRGGAPQLGVILVVGRGWSGPLGGPASSCLVKLGLVVVPGLVVVAALLVIARVVAGVEVATLTTGLGWRSDGKLVWTDSGLVAALVTLAVLPAVGTGQAGSLTAGVAAVWGDGLSLVLSLHHGHGRQPRRLVVRSHGLHMAPGNVGHVWYVWYMGHGCQHTERMVAAAYTARYLEKYFCKRIYTIWVTSF